MKLGLDQIKDSHKGESCFILGNGPSLKTNLHNRLLTSHVTFGMNRTIGKIVTDYYCLISNPRWEEKLAETNSTILYCGYVSVNNKSFQSHKYTTVKPTRNKSGDLLEGHFTSNTGVFAIYMAGWMGFESAHLLGFDCGVEGHFGEHSIVMDRTPIAKRFDERWGPEISLAFPELKIYNCNRDSHITYWPFDEV